MRHERRGAGAASPATPAPVRRCSAGLAPYLERHGLAARQQRGAAEVVDGDLLLARLAELAQVDRCLAVDQVDSDGLLALLLDLDLTGGRAAVGRADADLQPDLAADLRLPGLDLARGRGGGLGPARTATAATTGDRDRHRDRRTGVAAQQGQRGGAARRA